MPVDHSQSYKGYSVRAIGHRHRLKKIFNELQNMNIRRGGTLCDLGCSNGYITDQISDWFELKAIGLDHNEDHLVTGRQRYPRVEFGLIDLNKPYKGKQIFDCVTCFETLEHVGNILNSVQNITARIAPGGYGLISVPIEHGTRGIIKFVLKKYLFDYSFSELNISEKQYRRLLFSNNRISYARPPADGYGTHFGFDYREVDDALAEQKANFIAFNAGMSRFYRIFG